MMLPDIVPIVCPYRARILQGGGYADENVVACGYFVSQTAFVSFWIEPKTAVRSEEELNERMLQHYSSSAVEVSMLPIAQGTLTSRRLKLRRGNISLAQIPLIIKQAFRCYDDQFQLRDFRDAQVCVQPDSVILGTIDTFVRQNLSMVQLSDAAASLLRLGATGT
jgi:hypothetical protein